MNDVIFAYSRAQAIADGVLIDVSGTAKECGFRYPVAVTAAVWGAYVSVPEEVSYQDEMGRLWDILSMVRFGIKVSPNRSELLFPVMVQNDESGPKKVTLKAAVGPGDDGEPVFTVMLPNED